MLLLCANITKTTLSKICASCKFSDTKTMTATNLKRTFGLTNEDIEKSNLNYFDVNCRGNAGRKFIVSEIEEYVAKLIEKGNIKLIDKKEKHDRQQIFMERKMEIEKFMFGELENVRNANIIKIAYKYIESDTMDIADIKKELIEEDIKIIKINNDKDIFYDNLTNIINEKIHGNIFLKGLGLSDDEIKIFINDKWFVDFSSNLRNYIVDVYGKFDNLVISKESILKTNIVKTVMNKIKIKILDKSKKIIRTHELINKLSKRKLYLRDDSQICSYYIDGGIDNVNANIDMEITSVDDIVEIMDEMNFYYKYTKYPEINKSEIRKYTEYECDDYDTDDYDVDDDYDTDDYDVDDDYYNYNKYHYKCVRTKPISEINLGAKIKSLKEMDSKFITKAPKNVIELYETVKKQMQDDKPKKKKKLCKA